MKTILLLAALILFALPAQADPIEYRVTFTKLEGIGTVDDMIFTYDPESELFTGLSATWWHGTYRMDFTFLCGTGCVGSGDPNRGDLLEKQWVLAALLAGGTWATFDSLIGHDTGFYLWGALNTWFPGAGYNSGNQASGTFTTTGPAVAPVPEPGTLLLCCLGLVGVIAKGGKNAPRHIQPPVLTL